MLFGIILGNSGRLKLELENGKEICSECVWNNERRYQIREWGVSFCELNRIKSFVNRINVGLYNIDILLLFAHKKYKKGGRK